jgi:hypothetical protein
MRRALLMVAGCLLAGCASTPEGSEAREEKVYRTGSNIPTREAPSSSARTYDTPATPLPPTNSRPRGLTGG